MKFLKKIGKVIIILFIIFILANGVLYVYCLITPKMNINKEQSYYLYDNSNNLIFNNNKDWITLDKISPYLIDATIGTEDKYFYYHIGFDYLRILKSMFNNIISGDLSEGASTITMQYARNLFLNYDKTWSRKIDESLLAFELETHYSKKEILEGYLNTINYGGVFGVENAAKYYFNKSASDLTLAEASMLAGIPQSPSNNNPLSNNSNAKKRQNVVLTLMTKNKTITQKEKEKAYATNLKYYGKINDNDLTSLMYFNDAVINELKTIREVPNSLIETGGLRIYTTLDIKAQEDLETSVTNNIKDTNLQTAGVMINSKSGEVMALIGGTNYNNSQFNRALNANRQVGSTMKPILYYAALESGFTASSSFTSEKTTFNLASNNNYSPKNYNDTYANGPISMGAAIAYSDNIYAVKTHLFLGEDMLVNMSNRLGISSKLSPVASLALGTGEISLIDMVSSYSTFANLGVKNNKHFITKIEDSKGNTLYEYKKEEEHLLNSSLVYILNEMLTYTYDSAFIDYNSPTVISMLPQITHKYAIKTGTTNTDMLIIGYNSDVSLGIWTGYDNNDMLTKEDSGIHKNIWINTMESYLKDKETSWYDIPDNVVGVLVDPITGKLADENSKKKIFYYIKGTEPQGNDTKDLDSVFNENNTLETTN